MHVAVQSPATPAVEARNGRAMPSLHSVPVRVATGAVIDAPCHIVFDRVARSDGAPMTAARFGGRWVVSAAEPPRRWCVETFAPHGWACVNYEFDETSTGCFLRETVEFRSFGWRRAFDEGLTRVQLERQSRRALARLKASLEQPPVERPRSLLKPAT